MQPRDRCTSHLKLRRTFLGLAPSEVHTQGLVDGLAGWKLSSNIWIEDYDVGALLEPLGVLPANAAGEVVLVAHSRIFGVVILAHRLSLIHI